MRLLRIRTEPLWFVWLMLIALLLAPWQVSRAATFEVNLNDDAGDGTCDATCTLRDAIEAANANAGADVISFNVGSGGAQTLSLTGALAITDPVTIDGTTQPGFSGTPLITIDGSAAPPTTDGLTLSSGGSTIQNLIISGFGGGGIVIDTGDGSQILNNAIAGNGGAGVSVVGTARGHRILGNSITNNGGLGIDLGAAGVQANDPDDQDSGPNDLQNYPVLEAATPSTVTGTMTSAPNTVFRLEFFVNTTCDASGSGEGETFLSFLDVTTDAAGSAAFQFVPPALLNLGASVTATATDPAGNTSEFSACSTVSEPIYQSNPAPGGPAIVLNTTEDVTADATIAVSNPGTAPLILTSVTLSNTADFELVPPVPSTINSGGADVQNIVVRCLAVAASGTPYTTNVSVSHNAPGGSASYTVNCTVNAPPPVPRYDSNPAVGPLPDLTAVEGDATAPASNITVANNGGAALDVTDITLTGDPALVRTTPSSFTVNPTGFDIITVECSTAAAGTFNTTISVTHNGTNVGSPANYTLRCIISPRSNISISPTSLPNGTVNVAYSQTITASGGVSPYTFSVSSGTLPPDLMLAQGGTLAGTPTTAGAYSFTVTARDNNGATGSRAYSITIAQPNVPVYTSFPTPGGVITINTIPNAQVNATITISNTGTATLRIASITVSNTSAFALLSPATFDVLPATSQTVTIRCLSPFLGTFVTAVGITHNATNTGSPANYTITCNITSTLLPTATPFGTPPGTLAPTAIPPTPTLAAPTVGAVNNEVKGQALRSGPYLGATLIGSVLTGLQYPILARSLDEGGGFAWYLIRVGNVTGWTSGRFFKFVGNPDLLPGAGSIFDQIDNAPDTGMTTMLPALTDMRRRPSGRAAILRTIPAGATVSVVGRTRQNGGNYWLHVRYEGQIGWIPAYVENSRGNWENVPIR